MVLQLKKTLCKIFSFKGKGYNTMPMTSEAKQSYFNLMASSMNEVEQFDSSDADEVWVLEETLKEEVGEKYGLDLGGYVVFSTDVTPQLSAGTAFTDRIKNFFAKLMAGVKTQKARWQRYDDIEDVMVKTTEKHSMEETGFSVGNFFKGYYYDAKQKSLFNEKSMTIDFFGVTDEFLEDVALELGKAFNQQCVLVYNRKKREAFILNTK